MLMIGNIAQFWRLTRELDVNGLRESLERPVSLRVLGSDLAVAKALASAAKAGALENVRINLDSIKNEGFRAAVRSRLNAVRAALQ